MTEITTMKDKLAAEFAALAADAGLEFVAARQLADNGLGRPEITWHYMDGLDTRLQLRAAFGNRSVGTVISGQATAERDLAWFRHRSLYPKDTGSTGGRALDKSADYADGDQLRRLLGIIRDLLAPYAKAEHTATETIYCRRCGQDHTETSAERLNAGRA